MNNEIKIPEPVQLAIIEDEIYKGTEYPRQPIAVYKVEQVYMVRKTDPRRVMSPPITPDQFAKAMSIVIDQLPPDQDFSLTSECILPFEEGYIIKPRRRAV